MARRKLTVKTKERGGKITTKGRRGLKRGQFALGPGTEEKRRGIAGRYPIDTKERARNALARVAQFGTPTEKATVKRAVRRKYPGIDVNSKRKGK